MSEKEYVVSVNRGVDLAQLESELTASSGAGPIPNRSVDIANQRPISKRQTHFMLTIEEAQALEADSRIAGVEEPVYNRDDITLERNATQVGDFTQTTSDTGSYVNWGLRRVNEETNIYGTGNTATGGYDYVLDGSGVDIVIQDSGIEAGHPEWEDADGTTRLQQLDWFTASGVSGSMPSGHYSDYHGHGTHVAGIAAGKTYGWGKGANIYAQKLSGLEGDSDPNGGITLDNCTDTLIAWHNAKTNGRPTIINMSWGYTRTYSNVSNGVHQGSSWGYTNDSTVYRDYGVGPWVFGNWKASIRLSYVDTQIQEMIDAGIIVCIASGNHYAKADVISGNDYNNTVTGTVQGFSNVTTTYHRGSSPFDDQAFMVGSITDSPLNGSLDEKRSTSVTGPGVNIWAPGHNIMSACSNTNVMSAQSYHLDSNYKQVNIGGTSMASPQVAGVASLYLQLNPKWNMDQLRTAIQADSKDVIYEPSSTNYDVTNALLGSGNRMLYNKFGVAQDGTVKNGMAVNNAAITLRK